MANNSGQICFAASRVYVQEGVYEKFLEAYIEAFKAKASLIGDPEDPASQLGPVVDQAQYERIMGIIDAAKDERQGTLLVGGKRIGSKVSHHLLRVFEAQPQIVLMASRATTLSLQSSRIPGLTPLSTRTKSLDLSRL